ncbi:MAG: DUF1538 domain-containing protein [Christensenellales bacterium]
MAKEFWNKLKESMLSVLPITATIFLLLFFFIPSTAQEKYLLAISSLLLIVGIALFSLGSDGAMITLGSGIGSTLSRKNKMWFMLLSAFVIGFIITFAEPDLMVLAKQVTENSSMSSIWLFIAIVSAGVGIFLLLGVLRLILKIKLNYLLAISYSIIFILALFCEPSFVAIAFDSGGVTTGPISVPLLIAFGLGFSVVRSKQEEDDSFGLVALSSIGPLFSVLLLSLFLKNANIQPSAVVQTQDVGMWQMLSSEFLSNLKEVAFAILPIIVLFVIFQIFSFKYPKTKVIRTFFGFFLVYLGVSIFLTGVSCSFLPLASKIGEYLATLNNNIAVIAFGLVLGALVIVAEPALHVLKKQVEDITNKTISQKVIVIVVSIGVSIAVALATAIALYPINLLYVLAPLYAVCLILTFVNTKLFSAVAFDSGGVASGTMAVSFILPMISGLSGNGGGFGTVAIIAIFPVFAMQILGLVYKIKLTKTQRLKAELTERNYAIVEFDYAKEYSKKRTSQVVEFDWNK